MKLLQNNTVQCEVEELECPALTSTPLNTLKTGMLTMGMFSASIISA